jgi:hypothetical protein
MDQKGSDIEPAGRHGTLTVTNASGADVNSIALGETVTLTLKTDRLDKVAGQAVWMVVRASDAGANGTLFGDAKVFEALCPSQISTMQPTKEQTTKISYRAPCKIGTAIGPIKITAVYSKCNEGCTTGAIASGMITPGQFHLNDITLAVRSGSVDPSCASPPPPPMSPMQDICHPTNCWEGDCGDGVAVTLTDLPLSVSRWDSDRKNYTDVGTVTAKAASDSRWGSLLHGPTMLGGSSSVRYNTTPGERV